MQTEKSGKTPLYFSAAWYPNIWESLSWLATTKDAK